MLHYCYRFAAILLHFNLPTTPSTLVIISEPKKAWHHPNRNIQFVKLSSYFRYIASPFGTADFNNKLELNAEIDKGT